MLALPIEVPEPFRSALESLRPGDVADLEAPDGHALYGRGLARAAVGRESEARSDFESALESLGDPCRVELAMLSVLRRRAVEDGAEAAGRIAEAASRGSALRARALLVHGLGEGFLRRSDNATEALVEAADIYRDLGDDVSRAGVLDVLGRVEEARGRLPYALHAYSLSLADKAIAGDRAGMAITLGNIGRLHLRASRFRDALGCFERDLAICREIGDEKGVARMHDDLGRAWQGLGDLERAEVEFNKAIEVSRRLDARHLEFYARKDLALLFTEPGRCDPDRAEMELSRARSLLLDNAPPYFGFMLDHVEGEILHSKQDPRAVELLEDAILGLGDAEMPDHEIPARVTLARLHTQNGRRDLAERCLQVGLEKARAQGYDRYMPVLNDAMMRLAQTPPLAIEESRAPWNPEATGETYDLRGQLGQGGFGAVYRAYDPRRACYVALKRIDLSRVYDSVDRERLIDSLRAEIEAVARVRHPGIVVTHAISLDVRGDGYVVQQHVDGRSLRHLMQERPLGVTQTVLQYLRWIAEALDALHIAGVVHRDIKPENIVLRRRDDYPVLVDFGIARVRGHDSAMDDSVVGTLEYMAPEQALGKDVDGRADLYSLGVLAFEWLAGVRPLRLRGETFKQAADDLSSRSAPRLMEFRPDAPVELDILIGEMLEKKKKRRPRTAREVAERASALISAGGDS